MNKIDNFQEDTYKQHIFPFVFAQFHQMYNFNIVLNNDKNFFEFKAAYYYCSLIVLLSVVYFSAVDSVCHNLLICLS